MSAAHTWLLARAAYAPASLRVAMLRNLDAAAAPRPEAQMAEAALAALRAALRAPWERASAHQLLAADALFTHACEAAAESGTGALVAFADEWDARRFDELLPPETK